jgi:hypothetical protein
MGQQTRAKNYKRLIAEFESCVFDQPTPTMPRYAAFMEEFFDEQRVGVKIALCETEQQAFDVLGASVLDGYAPDGVYDLDTAEKIDIEVSTPAVTRAKVQLTGVNWLQD